MVSFLFDKRDHEMIHIVNGVYDSGTLPGYARKLYYSFFHPLGIKELAESKGLRTAYAIVNLLESMERGEIDNRLAALKGLKEDIFSAVDGPMPKNTARVLFEIMKDLVRAKGNYSRQLELSHDFRMAAFGKPRVIRQFLDQYHLLEMPEAWNQMTFDDHVHDANTSGRKTPTHLIMDAWIKGIRRLRVIYHHYLEPKFALELIEAARIMEIDLRIGIEFMASHRQDYISLVWVSRGLPDAASFLCFLSDPRVVRFMAQGKAVVKFQEKSVLGILDQFNERHLGRLERELGIQLEKICPRGFIRFALPGQPSMVSLAEYIHHMIFKSMEKNRDRLHPAEAEDAAPVRASKDKQGVTPEDLGVQQILSRYLCPSHPFDPFLSFMDPGKSDFPDRLTLDVKQLLAEIQDLHHEFRLTLNLNRLKPWDVVELLYDSQGLINRIEIINLKYFGKNEARDIIEINALQDAINQGSLIKLKRLVRQIIQEMEDAQVRDRANRRKKLMDILHDLEGLKYMYGNKKLKSRIGSDSSGKNHQAFGMGFGVVSTLGPRAVTKNKKDSSRLMLPARINISQRVTYPSVDKGIFRHLPGFHRLVSPGEKDWVFESFVYGTKTCGNIVTLGKVIQDKKKSSGTPAKENQTPGTNRIWRTLNTPFKNILKCVIGFVPAFLCFMMTKEWWFLAYFGAFIWFGITGIRNILQSILGGGGLKRSSMVGWKEYVRWDRLADSLLFTGFSVPLLDFLVKTLLLDRGMGINTGSNPIALYSFMALANGMYLMTHNIFRGLPRGACAGNFFRSILSIPIALLFNTLISLVLILFNVPSGEVILQKWAAIISKAASDAVAGVIEGLADRFHNIGLRQRDVQQKFSDLFTSYSKLSLLFPETEEFKLFEKPETLFENRNSEVRDLTVMIVINCLDLLYFFMILPRARLVITDMASRLTPEEKNIFYQSQKLLSQEQQISRLFVDGILGKNFSRPLSFYLTSHGDYLNCLSESFKGVKGGTSEAEWGAAQKPLTSN